MPTLKLYDLLVAEQSRIPKDGGREFYVFDKRDKSQKTFAVKTREAAEQTKAFKSLGENARILGVPDDRIVITCGHGEAVVCPGVSAERPLQTFYYLFKYEPNAAEPDPEMGGEDLKLSGTRQDFDPTTGEPIVLMQFTGDGEKKFAAITRELATRGRLQSQLQGQTLLQHFAIVLDDDIKSWPSIDFEENPNGISGSNGAQITGMAGINEAKDLAIVLQTGALPVEFRTLEETQISATLGQDSLRQAYKAAIAGLIAVALFLLIAYRFLGLVAVIGLGIYAAFLYGALLLFDVTLTLPGFAGMILTIGVAADANIVVFERIKEEAREGKSVRAAIASGYGKGLSTIIDANVVTAITALVLFSLATAGGQGLRADAPDRYRDVGHHRGLRDARDARPARRFQVVRQSRVHGRHRRRDPELDQARLRRQAKHLVRDLRCGDVDRARLHRDQGLNLGIDFEGGTEISFTTQQPTSLEDVRAEAEKVGAADAVIQGTGNQLRATGTRRSRSEPRRSSRRRNATSPRP